jgi:hypothetical protein
MPSFTKTWRAHGLEKPQARFSEQLASLQE